MNMQPRSARKTDAIVGQNYRLLRKAAGLSQSEIGKVLNISFQQVQKYEKGTSRLSAGRLAEAARYLNLPIMQFFEGVETHDGDEPLLSKTTIQIAAKANALPSDQQQQLLRIVTAMKV